MFCNACSNESAPTSDGRCSHCAQPVRSDDPTAPFGLTYERLDLNRRSALQRFQTKWDCYPTDAWCRRRWVYRLSLAGLFLLIAFYVGPNRILFGRWTWLTPDDFVPVVRDQCEPIVRAIKVYQRDHGGQLPREVADALPPPLPSGSYHYAGEIWQNAFEFHSKWNHTVHYDFTPGREGWSVRGAFTRGPIHYPPVPPPPAATQP